MAQQDRWTEGGDRGFGAEERRFRQGPDDEPGRGWAYGDEERAFAAGYGIDEGPYGGRWGRGPGEGGYSGQSYSEQGEAGGPAGSDRTWMERAGERLASWFGGPEIERSHRGRGPRNYVRPDARIAEDVNDGLTEDGYVDASGIAVSVANGEVTLSGKVATREERRRAEDLAERVSGVRHVQNDIRVEPRDRREDDRPLPVPMV